VTLDDTLTEYRLLMALIFEPEVLGSADSVEVDDFTDPRCQAVLSAIRNLQHRGMLVNPIEIDAALRRLDDERGTTLAEKAGLVWIALVLLADSPCGFPVFTPYNHAVLWEHDIAWLRELARRRQEIRSAA
jgi:DnaB helicase-like protein